MARNRASVSYTHLDVYKRQLLDYGCDLDEIEELLYDPALLHEMTGELLYAY